MSVDVTVFNVIREGGGGIRRVQSGVVTRRRTFRRRDGFQAGPRKAARSQNWYKNSRKRKIAKVKSEKQQTLKRL